MIMSLHQIFIYRNDLEEAGSPPWVHFLSFLFSTISVLLGPQFSHKYWQYMLAEKLYLLEKKISSFHPSGMPRYCY